MTWPVIAVWLSQGGISSPTSFFTQPAGSSHSDYGKIHVANGLCRHPSVLTAGIPQCQRLPQSDVFKLPPCSGRSLQHGGCYFYPNLKKEVNNSVLWWIAGCQDAVSAGNIHTDHRMAALRVMVRHFEHKGSVFIFICVYSEMWKVCLASWSLSWEGRGGITLPARALHIFLQHPTSCSLWLGNTWRKMLG